MGLVVWQRCRDLTLSTTDVGNAPLVLERLLPRPRWHMLVYSMTEMEAEAWAAGQVQKHCRDGEKPKERKKENQLG